MLIDHEIQVSILRIKFIRQNCCRAFFQNQTKSKFIIIYSSIIYSRRNAGFYTRVEPFLQTQIKNKFAVFQTIKNQWTKICRFSYFVWKSFDRNAVELFLESDGQIESHRFTDQYKLMQKCRFDRFNLIFRRSRNIQVSIFEQILVDRNATELSREKGQIKIYHHVDEYQLLKKRRFS